MTVADQPSPALTVGENVRRVGNVPLDSAPYGSDQLIDKRPDSPSADVATRRPSRIDASGISNTRIT